MFEGVTMLGAVSQRRRDSGLNPTGLKVLPGLRQSCSCSPKRAPPR